MIGLGAALFVGVFLTPGSDKSGIIGEGFGFALQRLFALIGLLVMLAVLTLVRAQSK